MDEQANFEYKGGENLDAMKEARNYNRFLLETLRQNLAGEHILDFGAGVGTFAQPLHSSGIDVSCVEPDAQLRNGLSMYGLRAFADIADVPDESVDFLYSLNVLEHIEDDCGALIGLYQRLRPGARILIYVPAFACLYSKMDELVGHHRRYRRSGLIAKMKVAGFQIEKAAYVDSLGFFAALAFRWLGRGDGSISAGSVRIYDRFIFPLSLLLDRIFCTVFGKNLLVVGTRPL